jgi:hypothetical protein
MFELSEELKKRLIAMTARDYDMEYLEVERIYYLFPNEFYEKLEEFIKIRSQQ